MSSVGWRLVQVAGAFLTAFLLPAALLVVVTGLIRTGLAGVLAVGALVVVLVLLGRAVLLRRELS